MGAGGGEGGGYQNEQHEFSMTNVLVKPIPCLLVLLT